MSFYDEHREAIQEQFAAELRHMSDQATDEEIMRVRRHECATMGHDFTVVQYVGSNDPAVVLCSRCGKTWKVDLTGPEPEVPSASGFW